jgi:DNA polymerase-1
MPFYVLPPAIKISTVEEAKNLVEHLSTKRLLAFDTETTGLTRHKERAIILSLSDGKGRWAVWPQVLPYFQDLLENPTVRLVGHNANFDQWMLMNIGIDLDRKCPREHARVYDTMVMHALLDDSAPHDLKYLARKYLGIDMVPFKSVYGKQMKTRSLTDILLDPENEEVTVNYSALDAFATYKLFLILQKKLENARLKPADLGDYVPSKVYPPYEHLWEYYTATEVMYTKVLWHMERKGIMLDVDALLTRAPVLEAEITSIERWFCHKLRRHDINLKSNPQMCNLFFNKLGYIPTTFTEGGQPQLNKNALKVWAKSGCQFATNLLRYRDLSKQLDTYVLGLLDHLAADGRIHTRFNQTGARTGRLSSADPNLQNQPPYIRDAYRAKPGYKLKARDQQQLEMRILAHVSADPSLCDAIRTGKDVHSATGANMYGVSYEVIMAAKHKDDIGETLTKEEKENLSYRKNAKTLNFGIMYGMGPSKLAKSLGVSVEEAKEIIKKYFAAVPRVKEYFDEVIQEARRNGYSSTIMGRRRQLPGIWSSFTGDVARAERQVKNAPIQGFASEILKVAMNRIFVDPLLVNLGVEMLVQVHDELVFEIPAQYENDPDIDARIQYHMVQGIVEALGYDLNVPLDTSGKSGQTWADCK